MKKLIIWLLLLATSFTADAQLIGGGPRKPTGGSTVDLSGYAVKAANNLFSGSNTFSSVLTTASISPDGHNTRALGLSSANWNIVWGTTFLSSVNGTAIYGTSLVGNNIAFRQGGTSQLVGGYFASTGNAFNQAAGALPADNGYRFQNYGTSYLGGNTLVTGVATFSAPLSVGGQATFGGLGEGGRIQFLRGGDGAQGLRVGQTGATANQAEIVTGSSINISGGTGATLTSSGASVNTTLSATGSSATVQIIASGTTGGTIEMQAGANKRFKLNTDGTIIYDPAGAFVNAGYGFDIQSNARVTGTLTLNDGTLTKNTGGTWSFGTTSISGVQNMTLSSLVGNNQFAFATSGVIGRTASFAVASALFELESTTKGLLIPRMTEVNKNAILSPAEGLLIYQNTAPKGWYGYDGASWVKLN